MKLRATNKPHDHGSVASSADAKATGSPQTAPPFHLGYRHWLDGLRGVAILAVLAGHLNLIPGGFLGVDVFFVLSGFLITTLLAEEWQRHGSISFQRFYLRRALRLLPAQMLLLLICGVVAMLDRSRESSYALGNEILVAACYMANWPALHGIIMPTLGHTWSLSVEEQFYVIWPLLLYGLLRSGLTRGRILLLMCVGIVAAAVLRALLYSRHPYPDPLWETNVWRLYMGLDTRADALLVGCLVGLLVAWDLLPKSCQFRSGISVAAIISATVLACMFLYTRHANHKLYMGFFTVVALMTGIILVRLLQTPSRVVLWLLESTPLVGIGRISYALYLFHPPLIHWLWPKVIGWGVPLATMLAAGASIAAAVFSYYLIERPCLRLKQRLKAHGRVEPETAAGPISIHLEQEQQQRAA